MRQILLLVFVSIYLIACGVFKMKLLKKRIPKTSIMFAHALLKYIVSFSFTDRKKHFDPKVIVVVILYSVSVYIFSLSAEHISILILAICSPTRLIFTFLLSKFLYSKKYTVTEHFALLIIVIGFAVANIKEKAKNLQINIKFIMLLLFGNFCNSAGCVFFDKKIKQDSMDYWSYMYTYNFLCLCISFVEMMVECYFSSYDFLFYLHLKEFYAIVVAQTIETFLIAYISFKLTPLQKGVNHIVCALSITIITNIMFEDRPSPFKILAIAITYLGCILFESKSIRKIVFREMSQ